jgi:hypothetical protein
VGGIVRLSTFAVRRDDGHEVRWALYSQVGGLCSGEHAVNIRRQLSV